jgi:hypothetical protein
MISGENDRAASTALEEVKRRSLDTIAALARRLQGEEDSRHCRLCQATKTTTSPLTCAAMPHRSEEHVEEKHKYDDGKQGHHSNESSKNAGKRPARLKVDLDQFLDPITSELMADPVVCQDGHTYDRTVIERHFSERRNNAAAAAAVAATTATTITDQDPAANTVCCGGQRAAIELTSPLTQEVVSPLLIPNRHVEQQIVALVEELIARYDEEGASDRSLSLTKADLDDWSNRREQKKVNDRAREEFIRQERLENERREQNAHAAEARRAAEKKDDNLDASSTAAGAGRPGTTTTTTRLVRTHNERLNNDKDLGLAVALCAKWDRVSVEYAKAVGGGDLRCAVSCCRVKLLPHKVNHDEASHSWCARCGRIVCSDCLSFQASDCRLPDTSVFLSSICTECAMHLTDELPRDGPSGRSRAVILRTMLQPRLETMFHRARNLLEALEAERIDHRHAEKLQRLAAEINELRVTRSRFQADIRQAENECAELLCHLDELLDSVICGDEQAYEQHMMEISDVRHRLEQAQLLLAIRRSSATTAEAVAPHCVRTIDMESIRRDELSRLVLVTMQGLLERSVSSLNHLSSQSDSGTVEKVFEMSRLQAQITLLEACMLRKMKQTEYAPGHTPGRLQLTVDQALHELSDLLSKLEADNNQSEVTELEEMLKRIAALEMVLQSRASDSDPQGQGDCYEKWLKALSQEQDTEWSLPMSLSYPTVLMTNHMDLLKNQLEGERLAIRARLEHAFDNRWDNLNQEKDALDDEVVQLQAQASQAQESAEAEQNRLTERRRRRQHEDAVRQQREQERRDEERRVRLEEEQLRQKHDRDEAATREAFASALLQDNTRIFGGKSDFRMCGRCRAGPIENFGCSNLQTHNNSSTTYKGTFCGSLFASCFASLSFSRVVPFTVTHAGGEVQSTIHPNHCPNCDWFVPCWRDWPKWDGVFGPH